MKSCAPTGKTSLEKTRLRKLTIPLLIPTLSVLGTVTLGGKWITSWRLKVQLKSVPLTTKPRELNEVVSSGSDLQVVRMPGHYWHGFKAVGNEPAMLLYFTTNLYNPS